MKEVDRLCAIRKAVKVLPPKPDADVEFAVASIMMFVGHRSDWSPSSATTPLAAAEQLEAIIEAIRQLCSAADGIGGLACEALNQVKRSRGLTWPPEDTSWSFMRRGELRQLLDRNYPEI